MDYKKTMQRPIDVTVNIQHGKNVALVELQQFKPKKPRWSTSTNHHHLPCSLAVNQPPNMYRYNVHIFKNQVTQSLAFNGLHKLT